ncbi:MAG: 2-oxoacid:ferredoxin oxidoreductase subunit beta [Candidatus Bostrichicola ureolyticus]|nr:MAG: 2-oxoacid:ferredoxin oxidoreductase subunit beta [Candidatus Bostrichicola ureolyticus]
MINFLTEDLVSNQKPKWCIGCGNYSILKQVQEILPIIGVSKENIVFISGIGCSSRFPYYMNTFGFHGIHGRAPAIATGVKLANSKLNIWIITGDGDSLAIGGNHLIHLLRRNINLQLLLINNEIYGLTKGQHSPTTKIGKKNKIDKPFNTLTLVLGAGGSFVARSIDRDTEHLKKMLIRCSKHIGTSFLEIYQNCNIFNDGVFNHFTDKKTKYDKTIFLEHDKPLIFGKNYNKGILLDGLEPKIVSLEETTYSIQDLWIHNEKDRTKANILARFSDKNDLPYPFGVLFNEIIPCYDQLFEEKYKSNNENYTFDGFIL